MDARRPGPQQAHRGDLRKAAYKADLIRSELITCRSRLSAVFIRDEGTPWRKRRNQSASRRARVCLRSARA